MTKICSPTILKVIKRNTGELSIIPRNVLLLARQGLVFTGGNATFRNMNRIPVMTQGTILCRQPMYPIYPLTIRYHPRPIDNHFKFDVETEKKCEEALKIINKQVQKMEDNSLKIELSEKIPEIDKPVAITLKNALGNNYTTTITQTTTVGELTENELFEELKKRQLIKKDDGKTECEILLKNNTVKQVGLSLNGYKLTQQGQAYHETLPKLKETIEEQTNPFPKNIQDNLRIGVVAEDKDIFIQDGKTKHLNLAVIDDPKEKYVIVIAYLTSKNTGDLLSEKQYKIFENEKEGKSTNKNKQEKLQKIVLYETPYKLDKKDFNEVKWDREYIQTISEDNLDNLSKKGGEYWKNGIKDFPQSELSYERGLEMCKLYDLNAQQKKPKHPITKDQIKQNEENKDKQHEKNKQKHEEKNKLQQQSKKNET